MGGMRSGAKAGMPSHVTETDRRAPRGLLLAALALTALLTAITIPTLSFRAPRGSGYNEAVILWLMLMVARWLVLAVAVAIVVRRHPVARVPRWAQLPLALAMHLALGLVSLSAFLTIAEGSGRTSVLAAVVYLALAPAVIVVLYRWPSLPFVRGGA